MKSKESSKNWSLRNLSLGLTAAALVFAGAAAAQTSQSGQTWQLVGVNSRLDHTLDTNSATQGQAVEAKLDGSVTTIQGTKLEKGTELTGTVTGVEKSANGGASSLTLSFTTAKAKDGKQTPVKVTLLSAFPASAENAAAYGLGEVGSAPRHVNPDEKIDQESGMLNNISLHSRVQGENSGTFVKKDGDLKLNAGTYLQVGIASMNANTTSSNGN
jgi:hypothetical protein